ncbi:MAG TPA: hypothetical protein EYG97_01030 [Arcobacter sp.]|nr:hypothetical protein [Arcobacter sp.]HIP55587.1 hypothetical protein [Arcobacter sp.]
MKKKSFTLVEVLVSVTLLSIVIATIFQIKENNLFYLDKFRNSSNYNELVSIATITSNNKNKLRNENIYLEKIVDFKDDDIRKELKKIKVNVKEEEYSYSKLPLDDISIILTVTQSKYKIQDKISTDIYQFKLESE